MIDIRKLKELVRLMVTNELTELDLRDSEEQVTLRRNSGVTTIAAAPMAAAPAGSVHAGAPGAAATSPAGPDDTGLHTIESPMVGTFFAAANPDSPPFVSVGTTVGPDTVVCIMEAMKIFNEIKAECSGTIQQVLVQNGESVEFGQPLYLVRPS